MIGIIDYGAGNMHSVEKAVRRLGFRTKLVTGEREAVGVNKLIFPGVGHAGATMQTIRRSGLDGAIRRSIGEGMPFLGICLGMQLLLTFSREGDAECLDLLPGEARPFETAHKVPHIGWNEVEQTMAHPIYAGIPDRTDFYFVHSYYASPRDSSHVAGVTRYGREFCSAVAGDAWIGVQFHPEKSGEAGLLLLHNFCKL